MLYILYQSVTYGKGSGGKDVINRKRPLNLKFIVKYLRRIYIILLLHTVYNIQLLKTT